MISMANSSINNKSIFRRISPSFKFIIFILSVFMFFVPAGFFGQIILVTFVLTSIIIARLSKKTYINLFKTFLIMTSIFILINWITNKFPIAIYDDASINNFGSNHFINTLPLINSVSYGYSSNIYIAPVLGNSEIINHETLINHVNYFIQNNHDVNKWINTLNTHDLNEAINKIQNLKPEFINDGLSFSFDKNHIESLLYVLNNDYTINGIEYNHYTITNIPQYFMSGKLLINLDGVVIYTRQWYSIGYMAFFNSISVSLKITMIICASIILTSTTTPSELTNGIEKIFSPLKIIKFPANQAALILSIGIRFIPSLLVESRRILAAQASRGLDFYNGNLWIKIKAIISLIIPLFTISINRSYDLANAMDARGFNPSAYRTKYRVIKTRSIDYIYLFIVVFIASILMFLWCYNFCFMPFGIVEANLVL